MENIENVIFKLQKATQLLKEEQSVIRSRLDGAPATQCQAAEDLGKLIERVEAAEKQLAQRPASEDMETLAGRVDALTKTQKNLSAGVAASACGTVMTFLILVYVLLGGA